MPFASGTFTRVSNSFSAPVAGNTIDPVGAEALFDDYDAAINELPTASVGQFGTIGAADDSAVFQAAIDAVEDAGGGVLLVPSGVYAVHGLTLPGGVILRGVGRDATYLQSWYADFTVLTTAGDRGGVEDLTIYGKGVNVDVGTFGATQPAFVVGGVENVIRNVLVWGGVYALYCTGGDNTFYDVNASSGYGAANVATIGADWYIRCKFDHTTTSVAPTDSVPFAAWAALTAYTSGQVRVSGGYALCCITSGTSAAGAPTLKNYGISITDGSAVWELLAPQVYAGFLAGTDAGENHLYQVDLSGAYSQSLTVNPGGSADAATFMTDGVMSSPVLIASGILCIIKGCELAGTITVSGGSRTIIQGNSAVGTAVSINVSANINNFIISDNFFDAGTITVAAGTSNRYRITNNPNCTVSDGGSGTDKVVDHNGAWTAKSYNKITITAPATSATLTLIDGTVLTGPALSGTVMTLENNQTVSGIKAFNDGKLAFLGSVSGSTVLNASAAAGGTTLVLPAANDTLVGKATTDTLTNKTVVGAGVNTISKVTPWNGGYVATRYYMPLSNSPNATLVMAADIAYFTPFQVGETHTFDRIAAQVTATGTATLVRLAIYNVTNGQPSTLVLDAGTVSVAGTGLKTITISQALAPGIYWMAVVADGSVTINGASCAQVHPYFTGTTDFATIDTALTATLTFGAFPATAFAGGMGAASYGSGAQNPTIGLRA